MQIDPDVSVENLMRAPQRPRRSRLSSDEMECWCWFDGGRVALVRGATWLAVGALCGGAGVVAGIVLAIAGYGNGWWTR